MYIKLYYKSTLVGKLYYINQIFEFIPSKTSDFDKNLNIIFSLKNLDTNKTTKSVELFSIFEEIYQNIIKRKDILSKLGNVELNNKFAVLTKYANLTQYEEDFHLKIGVLKGSKID